MASQTCFEQSNPFCHQSMYPDIRRNHQITTKLINNAVYNRYPSGKSVQRGLPYWDSRRRHPKTKDTRFYGNRRRIGAKDGYASIGIRAYRKISLGCYCRRRAQLVLRITLSAVVRSANVFIRRVCAESEMFKQIFKPTRLVPSAGWTPKAPKALRS